MVCSNLLFYRVVPEELAARTTTEVPVELQLISSGIQGQIDVILCDRIVVYVSFKVCQLFLVF